MQNPLSGILYCGICGSTMNRLGPNHHTKYDTVRCSNRYCSNVSAPLSRVEEKIIEALAARLDEYKTSLSEIGRPDAKSKAVEAIKKAEQEIVSIERQISATYDFLEQGIYSPDVFSARNKELDLRKKEQEQRIKKLSKEATAPDRAVELPSSSTILTAYQAAQSADEKNDILTSVVARIEYTKSVRNRRGQKDHDSFILDIFLRI